ncbi:hypothetical protein LTR91_000243 [Friedmanniomyces endolithicus]|uniref:Uncharacterized protein n=1 Tax=Friedmanniomyces endolithicus TaxID=329885 RepID=A0AAN6FGG5_9PEZI|nr:hypothetical protein LTR35_007537 [Friedmanniomyces endolithicus]KAK0295125.1 hypothetical protein LTS00_006181 [Friedmanniomyces endolithicus]KAK0317318.1 hypothetical protein LTR82_011641 [Friedmanniomyces endolithicus]KAK0931294.1 hypothetical protein LTR57_000709 [Friedmanniomyces endolithicus]KAK1010443.1 hypothetical protein LTR54_005398 [Friedmanniomyces endolithicus]
MLSDFFRSFLSYNVRRPADATPSEASDSSPTAETSEAVSGTASNPIDLVAVTPTALKQPATPKRGRPAKRLTSCKRISTKCGPMKKDSPRKPLTPTTKTTMAKERRHRAYVKKRAQKAEEDRILSREATYWRVLRSGKKYRSLGGTRRS